jgi:hypothetical protein
LLGRSPSAWTSQNRIQQPIHTLTEGIGAGETCGNLDILNGLGGLCLGKMAGIQRNGGDLAICKRPSGAGNLLIEIDHLGQGRDGDVGTVGDVGLSGPMAEDQVSGLGAAQERQGGGGGRIQQ